ncbi:RidA family protein [Dactylosporangium vinaceum]|uniref:RidA family protein n=1 Tax=Dactylosporangium vinaceum TaxID=53362 RepID=A0ABV5M0B5_9ACTN|nr:RidA family protein [Dactylosporangium vinaceum]UAB98204.1 RidA family protein [Dactylosporangium vinaceum]
MVILDSPRSVVRPAGPYSHVARVDTGDVALLFLAGQIAADEDGAVVHPGDMEAQARYIFDVIHGILAAHGGGFEHVAHIRTFVTDLGLLPQYGKVRRELFPEPAPASTTVEIARLFRAGALLEVEVTAAVPVRARG